MERAAPVSGIVSLLIFNQITVIVCVMKSYIWRDSVGFPMFAADM